MPLADGSGPSKSAGKRNKQISKMLDEYGGSIAAGVNAPTAPTNSPVRLIDTLGDGGSLNVNSELLESMRSQESPLMAVARAAAAQAAAPDYMAGMGTRSTSDDPATRAAVGAELEAEPPMSMRYEPGPAPARRMPPGGTPEYKDRQIDKRIEETDKVEVSREMAESKRRAQRKGLNGQKGNKVEQMTLEEYAALTPKQKAAIDLNTMLVEAVRKDTDGEGREEGKKYDDRVDALFGGVGDDQPFAPATVKLLEKINYQGNDTNVNDFLQLKAAFTAADIENLAPLRPGEAPDANLMNASNAREALLSGVQQIPGDDGYERGARDGGIVEALLDARADKDTRGPLLDTQRSLLGTNKQLGFGAANPTGSMEEQLNDYFQKSFEAMSTKGFAVEGRPVEPKAIMAEAKSLLNAEEWAAFVAFLDVKSRESKQYDIPLGMNPETDYVKPNNFRAKLKLNQ